MSLGGNQLQDLQPACPRRLRYQPLPRRGKVLWLALRRNLKVGFSRPCSPHSAQIALALNQLSWSGSAKRESVWTSFSASRAESERGANRFTRNNSYRWKSPCRRWRSNGGCARIEELAAQIHEARTLRHQLSRNRGTSAFDFIARRRNEANADAGVGEATPPG